ncbi:Unknown protein sequence [Pseudomonas coronafaciens pv. oryzae]|nr:Unknown protein sequence [Pseudomonas coronafaciens pv. oryzae]
MGWDEPVRDSVVCLPHSGRSLAANLEPNQMTGMYEKNLRAALENHQPEDRRLRST